MRGAVGLAFGLLVGCGGAGEGPTFAEFFAAAEVSYCEWAVRCGAYEDATSCTEQHVFDVLYPRHLLASGALVDDLKTSVEYLQASHAAGRISYDGDAAERCLAYVAARGCQDPGSYAPDDEELAGRAACAAIFLGTLGADEACGLSLECAGEANCEVDTCEDACCSGHCVAVTTVPLGASCSSNGVCEAGSICAFDEGALDYLCKAPLSEGANCQGSHECADELFCRYDFDAVGVCTKRSAIGAACNSFSGDSCAPHSFCVDPDFDGVGRCETYQDLGEPCSFGCRDLSAACDGTCVARPRAGQPCLTDGTCALSASCDLSTMTCVAEVGIGEPCGADMMGSSVTCGGDLQCSGNNLLVSKCLAPGSYACPLP